MNISSEISRVRPALAEAMEYIRNSFPDADSGDETDLRLILSELLFNAVIHGNKNDADKTVFLEMEAKAGAVHCRIADQGEGFDYISLIRDFSMDPWRDLDSEHGRGVRLAVSLADELSYIPPGNQIYVIKRVNAHG